MFLVLPRAPGPLPGTAVSGKWQGLESICSMKHIDPLKNGISFSTKELRPLSRYDCKLKVAGVGNECLLLLPNKKLYPKQDYSEKERDPRNVVEDPSCFHLLDFHSLRITSAYVPCRASTSLPGTRIRFSRTTDIRITGWPDTESRKPARSVCQCRRCQHTRFGTLPAYGQSMLWWHPCMLWWHQRMLCWHRACSGLWWHQGML